MTCIAFQIIGGLIEISNPGYVVLQTAMSTKYAWLQGEMALHVDGHYYTPYSGSLLLLQLLAGIRFYLGAYSDNQLSAG